MAGALPAGVGVGGLGDVALELDVHAPHRGRRAGLDGDHHHRLAAGRVFAPQLDLGREVALGAQQVAHVAFGQRHQARELGVVQVADGAVALQLVVALDEGVQVLVVRVDADLEGLGGGGVVGRITRVGWRALRGAGRAIGGVTLQDGAAGQHQHQRQHQRRQGGAGGRPREREQTCTNHPHEFSRRFCRTAPHLRWPLCGIPRSGRCLILDLVAFIYCRDRPTMAAWRKWRVPVPGA